MPVLGWRPGWEQDVPAASRLHLAVTVPHCVVGTVIPVSWDCSEHASFEHEMYH